MNRHIELPIAGSIFGNQTTSWTGASYKMGDAGTGIPIGAVFCAPETDTITHIGLPFAANTGIAARTFRMEIRNVNSDGTIGSTVLANSATLSYSVIGTTYTTATTTNPVIAQIPLTSSYQITRGSLYAIVANAIGGTWNGSNYMNIVTSYIINPRSMNQSNLPYFVVHSPAPTTIPSPIFLAVSSTKFYGVIGPYRQQVDVAGTSTAYGNFFTLPATFGQSVRLCGVKFAIFWTIGGYNTGNFNIKVYNSTGSTLYVDNTLNFNVTMTNSPTNDVFLHYFDTPVTLTAGQTYFIGIACQDDSLSMNCLRIDNYPEDFDKVKDMLNGGQISLQAGQVTSGGSVAVTDQYIMPINPLIDLITDVPSGGGASTTAVFNQGFFN